MIIIVCVDDDWGMTFNNRRQSRDRNLRERILEITDGSRLWMNHYSAKQFCSDNAPQINIDENFLSEALLGEYCFVENVDVIPYAKWVEKVIVYKWNRKYPADQFFSFPLKERNWRLIQATEFTGYSHEKITEEIYFK